MVQETAKEKQGWFAKEVKLTAARQDELEKEVAELFETLKGLPEFLELLHHPIVVDYMNFVNRLRRIEQVMLTYESGFQRMEQLTRRAEAAAKAIELRAAR